MFQSGPGDVGDAVVDGGVGARCEDLFGGGRASFFADTTTPDVFRGDAEALAVFRGDTPSAEPVTPPMTVSCSTEVDFLGDAAPKFDTFAGDDCCCDVSASSEAGAAPLMREATPTPDFRPPGDATVGDAWAEATPVASGLCAVSARHVFPSFTAGETGVASSSSSSSDDSSSTSGEAALCEACEDLLERPGLRWNTGILFSVAAGKGGVAAPFPCSVLAALAPLPVRACGDAGPEAGPEGAASTRVPDTRAEVVGWYAAAEP